MEPQIEATKVIDSLRRQLTEAHFEIAKRDALIEQLVEQQHTHEPEEDTPTG